MPDKFRISSSCLLIMLACACGGSGSGVEDENEDEDEDEAPAQEPQDPANFANYFAARPYGDGACDVRDGALKGQREVRLFSAGGRPVIPYARALQRYFNRHDLSFFTRFEPTPVEVPYALDTDEDSLKRAARAAFPGLDFDDPDLQLTPEQEERLTLVVTNQMLSPIIRFAQRHSAAGDAVTNVVALEQILRPGGMKLTEGEGEIAGLAISPALLSLFSQLETPEGAIWRGVNLPEGFSPMMFLHGELLERIARQDEVARDLVVAHEFGHTAALVHVKDERNLMLASLGNATYSCADGLNSAQIARVQATFDLAPSAVQALAVARPKVFEPVAPGARLSEVRALLSGKATRIPSFLRPLLHTHPRSL